MIRSLTKIPIKAGHYVGESAYKKLTYAGAKKDRHGLHFFVPIKASFTTIITILYLHVVFIVLSIGILPWKKTRLNLLWK